MPLMRERIWPHLPVRSQRLRALAAFYEPRGPIAVRGPEPASLPTCTRIVDAAVEPLRIEAHRIRHAQHEHLSVLERDHAVVEIAGCNRHVLAKSKRVVLIDPGVVARLSAVVADTPEAWSRELMEAPAFRAMVAGGLRAAERGLALAAIEASKLATRQRDPDDAIAVDVAAARTEPWLRHVVDLGDGGFRRIWSRHHTNHRTRVGPVRAPD